jgi:hypothetical protein
MSSVLTSPSPVTCHHETVRRGRVESAEAKCRWIKRPVSRDQGWHDAVLEINGARYDVSCFFTCDDDNGFVWQVIDLTAPSPSDYDTTNRRWVKVADKHYRITIGPNGAECDCPHMTYRGCMCKHASAVQEALDWLDRLEQAERLLAEANAYLQQLEAIGPPPSEPVGLEMDIPELVELDLSAA